MPRLWLIEILPPFLQAAVGGHLRLVKLPQCASQFRSEFLIRVEDLGSSYAVAKKVPGQPDVHRGGSADGGFPAVGSQETVL
jgi:hypothetical protein